MPSLRLPLRSRRALSPPPLLLLLALLAPAPTAALDNGVGRLPAMGWSSWNTFRCDISAELVLEVADALVASGLASAGYRYVHVDDCWMTAQRGADGHLQVDKTKFPLGMRALGDELHARGLLFGIYSAAGNKTCEGYAASWGHEAVDAADFAAWGVDALKYDFCDCAGCDTRRAYTAMGAALAATGRALHFGICSWGGGAPHVWGAPVAHSWRTGRDLFATFAVESEAELGLPSFLQSVMSAVDATEPLGAFAGPGHVNDPDMLLVGLSDGMVPYGVVQTCPPAVPDCTPGEYISRERWGRVGGLNADEQRSHFALWAMLAAPLILGNDPRGLDEATAAILTAPGVLQISQDEAVRAGRRSWREAAAGGAGGCARGGEVWRRELAGGDVALLLLNACRNASRDVAALWARDVAPAPARCVDRDAAACAGWAASGECERNPGFMADQCGASCPSLCAAAAADDEEDGHNEAEEVSARVVDAWTGSEVGTFRGGVVAHALPPHASRLLRVTLLKRGADAEETREDAQLSEPPPPRAAARKRRRSSKKKPRRRKRTLPPPQALTDDSSSSSSSSSTSDMDIGTTQPQEGRARVLMLICLAAAAQAALLLLAWRRLRAPRRPRTRPHAR